MQFIVDVYIVILLLFLVAVILHIAWTVITENIDDDD